MVEVVTPVLGVVERVERCLPVQKWVRGRRRNYRFAVEVLVNGIFGELFLPFVLFVILIEFRERSLVSNSWAQFV